MARSALPDGETAMHRLRPAIEATARMAQSEEYMKHVANLGPWSRELAAHMSEGDRASMLVPAAFDGAEGTREGKPANGWVLTLQDRAVFVWWTGLIRIKDYDAVVPYASITSTERDWKPATTFCVTLPLLRVHAEQTWTIEFPNCFGAEALVPHFHLPGVMAGAITFEFEDEDPSPGQDPTT